MNDGHELFAGANLALALTILALTLSTFRGRRPRHIRSWVFFGLASLTLVVSTGLEVVGIAEPLPRAFHVLTTTFLAIGFAFLYGADQNEMRRVQELAERDAMTGLYNLRTFRKLAGDRLAHAVSHAGRCAVAVLDLDGFKRLNDTQGHPAGDHILQLVARAMSANLRSSDVAARYGGDEFVLFLDRCDADEARSIVKRICASAMALSRAAGGGVSLSAGIALFPECGSDVDGLVRSADMALLGVKRAGKNDVRVAAARA
ncbi:MAG TPA: GGDEF domain-containing protein [Candidatus Limnocylindrales bacterium]|nr:GGDEF domain-containing protein [Candidatus Limnocylindrales bacterium]